MKKLLTAALFLVSGFSFGQNVGIGTNNPSAKLEVTDSIKTSVFISSKSYFDTSRLVFRNRTATNLGTDIILSNNNENGLFFSSLSDLPINTHDSIMHIVPHGRVGINKINPQEQLDVRGNINLTGALKVAGNGGTAGQVLTSSGTGAASVWANSTASIGGNIGYGTWGDCGVSANIINYQPVVAADGAVFDYFGSAVDISGNYAVIGASGKNLQVGAAYIFFKNGNQWEQQAKLMASDGISPDNFGSSVAINGDYAVVGAPLKNNGAVNGYGAVYIFKRTGTIWTQEAKILHTDPLAAANDRFGSDVDIEGIYMVASAPSFDLSPNGNQGAVFYFTRSGTTWSQTGRIISSLTTSQANGGYFGSSLDLNNNYLAVGAPFLYNAALTLRPGGVFTFFRTGPATWVQQSLFNGAFNLDEAGTDVSLSNEYLLFGTPRYENDNFIPTVTNAGKLTIAKRNVSVWTKEEDIPTQISEEVSLGSAVDISGNIAIAISVRNRIYIYKLMQGAWLQFQLFQEPNTGIASPSTVAVDGNTGDFVIGNLQSYNSRGKVVFGKVN